MKLDDHFVAWVFVYAISAYISIQVLSYFNLLNSLIGILVAGLIITLLTWIISSLLYHNKFVLNKWFFIWLFTHAFNFWWIDLILRKINLTYQGFLYFFLFGLVYRLVTWVIKHKIFYRIKMNTSKTIISIILLVGILLFVSAQPFSEISSIGFAENSSIGSIIQSLTLSSFQLGNSCPQLNVQILNSEMGTYISNMGNIDSSQEGWMISVYNTAEMFGIRTDFVFCHTGNVEGESPNYFYCDSGGLAGGIPYISKTTMNSDGTIGKTIKKSFVNIYTKEGAFVKTICGKDPETIAEEDFKKQMRELDDLFSLK